MNQAGDGLPKVGDRFVQPDLAKTLDAVSKKGARYMYDGAWGRQFVEAVQREGGKATLEDMKLYHYCPAKISEGHPNPLKISMITHGRSENDFN